MAEVENIETFLEEIEDQCLVATNTFEAAIGDSLKNRPKLKIERAISKDQNLTSEKYPANYSPTENVIRVGEKLTKDPNNLALNFYHELTHAYIEQERGKRDYKSEMNSTLREKNVSVARYESAICEEIINEGLATYISIYITSLKPTNFLRYKPERCIKSFIITREGNTLNIGPFKKEIKKDINKLWDSSFRYHQLQKLFYQSKDFLPNFLKDTNTKDMLHWRFSDKANRDQDYTLGKAHMNLIFRELIFQGLSVANTIRLIAMYPPQNFEEMENYDSYLKRISKYILGKNHIAAK